MNNNTLRVAMSSFIIRRQRRLKTIAGTFATILKLIAGLPKQNQKTAYLLLRRQFYERSVWKFERSSTFWEVDVPKMDNKMFRDNFRLKRESFHKLCDMVKSMEKGDTNFRACIPLQKRVGIAMYALGSSAEYRTISHLFGVGVSTVREIVLEFCHAIINQLQTYVNSYPPTEEEIERIVGGFESLGFPQCFGAIDGCHIPIQPPKEHAVDYYNYKGWYSTVLLAACDHRSKFTYLNIGSAGKNNDSYIFENSSLKRFHEYSSIFAEKVKLIEEHEVPIFLIGDSAFRLSRYVMKPFPYKPNQPQVEKLYNYNLSKCRRVIENAFGQLKARFRKLGKGLEVSIKNCNIVIYASCLLHNFLKVEEDEVEEAWIAEYAATSTLIQPNSSTNRGENDYNAKTIRDVIASSFQHDGPELSSASGEFNEVTEDDV